MMLPPGPPGGGMPPMAGNMAPGMGQSPMGGPPPAAMAALDQLQQAPPGEGAKQLITNSIGLLQGAVSQLVMRSPTASKHLSQALEHCRKAQQALAEEPQAPVSLPPDLMGGPDQYPGSPNGQGSPQDTPGGFGGGGGPF